MATHDYIVDNQNGANFRSDLNNALAAIVSNNSSATAPTTTYAFMWWADTANDILKQRNAADSAWINILTLSTGLAIGVADDAVTLAKMAAGTDGELITYDTSGNPTTVPVGTSAQVLTSNGAGATPTFQDAAGGADTSLSNLSATGENRVAQAWVNFNGTGTVAIRDSHNVSSITDNGVGIYVVNFSNNMPSVNYAVAWYNNCYANAGNSGAFGNHYGGAIYAIAVGSCGLSSATSGYTDSSEAHALFFGD